MRRLTIPTLIAIIAIAALMTLGGSAGAAPKTTVVLGDNFFSPSTKTVRKGTKVRFKWTGRKRHNVTKVSGPGGGFASRTTKSRGVNFAKKFKKAGTYGLVCTIHAGMGMTLRVVR
jgi:plastocyanin